MTTAVEVAERALKRIIVQADDAPLDPSDYADFYDSMNAFMDALEGEGIRLGYTTVTNPADEITIPPGAIRGLVANMAVEVAPDYGKPVSAELAKQALDGLRVMKMLGRQRIQTSYPANLPMGSGREDLTTQADPFYGIQAYAVLHLINEDLLTEFSTGVTSKIRGFWEIGSSKGLMADITGRIRNTTPYKVLVTVNATLYAESSGADTFQISLENSGVSVATDTKIASAAETLTFTLNTGTEIEPGGTLLITAKNTTGTNALRFYDSRVEVS